MIVMVVVVCVLELAVAVAATGSAIALWKGKRWASARTPTYMGAFRADVCEKGWRGATYSIILAPTSRECSVSSCTSRHSDSLCRGNQRSECREERKKQGTIRREAHPYSNTARKPHNNDRQHGGLVKRQHTARKRRATGHALPGSPRWQSGP